ncbi:MAG: phosphonoacetaldehyde reductase [Coriobacteriia bacterium]|nr:phosphonoacetaldehyde reductase [Coriobacteriia bacterium]
MARDPLCPVSIEFCSLDGLREELAAAASGERVVLVATRGTVERLGLGDAVAALGHAAKLVWLDGDYANPTQAHVASALHRIGGERPERIVCVGGGSAIDMGKAISALFDEAAEVSVPQITEAVTTRSYAARMQPIEIVAVPTTAGTGSEVTKWATIWDADGGAKYSIDDERLYPKRALVCMEATLTMPSRLILATALDALSHAMESFWARSTTPLVQNLALSAVREIHAHLGPALADPQDRTARDGLCLGSILAGVAFSNTRTTACHSISYPMTMRFGVEHGFAASMTLAPVAALNLAAVPGIGELLAVFEPDGGLAAWVDAVAAGIQPLRLGAFGIGESDIEVLVELSFTAGRMDNNPVDISPDQVREILRSIA